MHTGDLHETLAGIIRDAFFDARNAGETMYQASDVASARVLSAIEPSMARLQVEVDKLLAQWEKDRRGLTTTDWQSRVADTTLSMCLNELRAAVVRAAMEVPVLEDAG